VNVLKVVMVIPDCVKLRIKSRDEQRGKQPRTSA
jgi:hypothetical protein